MRACVQVSNVARMVHEGTSGARADRAGIYVVTGHMYPWWMRRSRRGEVSDDVAETTECL